jgi:hypothetical protein
MNSFKSQKTAIIYIQSLLNQWDDAGILRTNMIEQYVLLASRYKVVPTSTKYVYNSINYSFKRKGKKNYKGFRQSFYHFWGQFPLK